MRLTPKRVSLLGLLQAAAFLTALVSLATLPNQLHQLLELFSHFRLQYLVVSLLLGAVLVLLRNRNWAVSMLVVAAVNAWTVLPWYLDDGARTAAGTSALRVVHANVRGHETRASDFIELLEREQPDLVFVQEVDELWNQSLGSLASTYPHRYSVPDYGVFGIAVLGRQPFVGIERHNGPPWGNPTLILATQIGEQPVTLVSTHAPPPIGPSGIAARNRQLEDIAEVIAGIDGPVVLIGDLNTSMWAQQFKLLVAATGLRDARRGYGLLPTWPTYLPFAMIPVDHCLVSAEVSVVDLDTGPGIGSDHLPLLVTLAL